MIPISSNGTLYSLQYLRAAAAILVVLHHAGIFLASGSPIGNFPLGAIGVDIFFPISGAVIYLSSRKLYSGEFLRRRIARVVPLYWLILSIKVCLLLLDPGLSSRGQLTPLYVLSSYIFIPARDPSGYILPIITTGWTLNFEMYFYLICTISLLCFRMRFLYGTTVIILAGIFIGSQILPVSPPAPFYLLSTISLEFLGGVWIAFVYINGFRTGPLCNAVLFLTALIWLAVAPIPETYDRLRPLFWGVPGALVIWSFIMSERYIARCRSRIGLLLGDASYATYLTHPTALSIFGGLILRLKIIPGFVALVFVIIACNVLGLILHLFLEKRLHKWALRLMGSSQIRSSGD